MIGRDPAGGTVILAADDWLLEQLMTFDAGAKDLEGDDEADDSPPVLSFDRMPSRRVHRGPQ